MNCENENCNEIAVKEYREEFTNDSKPSVTLVIKKLFCCEHAEIVTHPVTINGSITNL